MSIPSNPFNPLSATSFATFPKSLEILYALSKNFLFALSFVYATDNASNTV